MPGRQSTHPPPARIGLASLGLLEVAAKLHDLGKLNMADWFTALTHDAAQATVVAGRLGAMGALLAAGVSALVSYLVARRAVYINSVTAERSKWMEALRATISKLSGAASKVHARRGTPNYERSEAWAADVETLRILLVDLTLRMNPDETEARHLLRAANKVDAAARMHSSAALLLADDILTRLAPYVLKAEWERVKQEASGVLCTPIFWWRSFRRKQKYNEVLASEGFLNKLDQIGAGKPDAELALLRSQMSNR